MEVRRQHGPELALERLTRTVPVTTKDNKGQIGKAVDTDTVLEMSRYG